MLFLLRQLRRLELRKRSGQYFIYAIGEIVLIVVGILIALQIQNWNQGRLDRIETRYLLEELIDNLNQEAERLEFGIEMTKERLEAYTGVKAFFESQSFSEEQFLGFIPPIFTYFHFNPNTSAYETMKNTGLGFSNRQLKARLVEYYDVRQVLLVERTKEYGDLQSEVSRPMGIKYFKKGESKNRMVPRDIHDPAFKAALLEPLDYLATSTEVKLQVCQEILEMNREIYAVVQKELEGM